LYAVDELRITTLSFDVAYRLGFTFPFAKTKEIPMAKKTILVCDMCGAEVEEQKGATMRVTYTDARRGSRQADLCDSCAGKQPGRTVARRGRRPKSTAA
jgi:hypothetical protein